MNLLEQLAEIIAGGRLREAEQRVVAAAIIALGMRPKKPKRRRKAKVYVLHSRAEKDRA